MSATAVLNSSIAARAVSSRSAVWGLSSASLAMCVDPSVHNIAFVGAANQLAMTGSQRSLVASLGTLCIAATILATGSLGDRIGRKKTMLAGLLLCVVSGIVTALAPSTAIFAIGRVLAGIGYAASFGLSFALLRKVAPDDSQLSGAVAQWLALQTLGVVLLGLLGGYLAGIGWRIAYLLPGAVAALSFLYCMRIVPEAKAESVGPLDAVGLCLIALGLVCTLDGVSNSASEGWGTARVLVPLAIGIAVLTIFAFYEMNAKIPAFPIKLFRDWELSAAALAGIAFNLGNAVIVLQLSLLWQYLYRYHPFTVSLGLMPFSVASIVAAAWVGQLLGRGVPNRRLVPVGLFVVAAAIASMSFAGANASYLFFLIPLLLAGGGLMFAQTPAARLFVSKAPPDMVGALASSRTLFGQFGFALGLAVSSSLLYGIFGPDLHSQLVRAGAAPGDLSQVSGIVQSYVSIGSSHGFNAQFAYEVIRKATTSYLWSFRITMLTLAGIIAFMGTLVYWQLSCRKSVA